jgi:hypothetical protein
MKILTMLRHRRKETANLTGQFPAPSHADHFLDRDTTVIAPDGSTIAMLLTQRIDPELWRLAFMSWRGVRELPRKRATAVGSPSLPALRKDGSLSKRVGVPSSVLKFLEESGVGYGLLGYAAATAKHTCHMTALTKRRPELIDGNQRLIERVNELYGQYMPAAYAIQRAEVEKAPRWRVLNTVFTTIYIIKNLRTAYHSDRNLPDVMTAMLPMGNFTGGELVLPEWRIAIAYRPGDLLLFDEGQLHGNLPFKGERLAAVFYYARDIADCGK